MSRQPSSRPLPRTFYVRPTESVAPELIGKVLVHRTPYGEASGRIVEVEAYLGEKDPASHAYRGPRGRAAIMFEAGGRAYVYFSYGIHYCFNVVTDRQGVGGAVLIRALEPVSGVELMRERRGRDLVFELASGPGKLTEALGIGPKQNGLDLVTSQLRLLPGDRPASIDVTPRIGITQAADWPLRFVERGSKYLSGKRTRAAKR